MKKMFYTVGIASAALTLGALLVSIWSGLVTRRACGLGGTCTTGLIMTPFLFLFALMFVLSFVSLFVAWYRDKNGAWSNSYTGFFLFVDLMMVLIAGGYLVLVFGGGGIQ